MSHRPRNDLPRLSGRPETPHHAPTGETQTVFRRFFELLEKFDRPHPGAGRGSAPTAAKSAAPMRKDSK